MARLVGTDNDDTLTGGDGPDTLIGKGGSDILDGGYGDDVVEGGAGGDGIQGDYGDDFLDGGAGNDFIEGGDGRDTLSGGADNDWMSGGGAERDALYGGGGADTLGGGVGDLLDGGAGHDLANLNLQDFTRSLRLDLRIMDQDGSVTFARGTTLAAVEAGQLTLGSGDNRVRLGQDAFYILGGAGDDKVTGGEDDDTINGAQGSNTIKGGLGDDRLTGDPFTGGERFSGGLGDDLIAGVSATDTASGGAGVDTLYLNLSSVGFDVELDLDLLSRRSVALSDGTTLAGFEGGEFRFGAGDDELTAAGERVVGFGALGADTLTGSDEFDILDGGAGDDSLTGLDGDDQLLGGYGDDTMTGGAGIDYFMFELFGQVDQGSVDRITDLSSEDQIWLNGIDADTTSPGDQAFVIVTAFSGDPGEARRTYDQGQDITLLELDTDGDEQANMTLVLDGDQRGFDNYVL